MLTTVDGALLAQPLRARVVHDAANAAGQAVGRVLVLALLVLIVVGVVLLIRRGRGRR